MLPEAVVGWKAAQQLEEVMIKVVKNKTGIAKNITVEFFKSFYAMKLKEQIQRRIEGIINKKRKAEGHQEITEKKRKNTRGGLLQLWSNDKRVILHDEGKLVCGKR